MKTGRLPVLHEVHGYALFGLALPESLGSRQMSMFVRLDAKVHMSKY